MIIWVSRVFLSLWIVQEPSSHDPSPSQCYGASWIPSPSSSRKALLSWTWALAVEHLPAIQPKFTSTSEDPRTELEMKNTSVVIHYLFFNSSEHSHDVLEKVPEFIEKHKDTESLLVESVCRKYRVSPPSGWYKTSWQILRPAAADRAFESVEVIDPVSSRCPVVSKSKSQTGDLFDLYSLYTILYLVPMVLILTCKHGRGCYTFWQAPVLGPFDMLVISHSEYIVAFRPAEKVLLLHEICYRLELYTSKWNERTRPLKSKEYVFSFKTRKVKTTLKERHKIPIRIRLWIGFAFLEKANTAIWYNLARCASHTSELCTLISS